jgi:hypothetical protein
MHCASRQRRVNWRLSRSWLAAAATTSAGRAPAQRASIVALQRYNRAEGWTISQRSAVISSYRYVSTQIVASYKAEQPRVPVRNWWNAWDRHWRDRQRRPKATSSPTGLSIKTHLLPVSRLRWQGPTSNITSHMPLSAQRRNCRNIESKLSNSSGRSRQGDAGSHYPEGSVEHATMIARRPTRDVSRNARNTPTHRPSSVRQSPPLSAKSSLESICDSCVNSFVRTT